MTRKHPSGRINNHPEYLQYQIKSLEKMPVDIFHDSLSGCKYIAGLIALAMRAKQQKGERIVLGLATGSSPIHIYKELVRLHKEEELSFYNVVTFNLDEYYPMDPESVQSYHRFMNEYLFDHVDIPRENIHIPDGTLAMEDITQYCDQYEKKIQLFGGIDIQLLGIGRTGHIGFNEPGSEENSITRLVRLDSITRRDAADDFSGLENVPLKAITMGIKTIMSAKEIYIVAWGQHKANIVKKALEGPITKSVTASFLQKHHNVKFCIDTAAAESLTRVVAPWVVGSCRWDDALKTKAVIWLSKKTGKPILKLTEEDYSDHGLTELLLESESAYNLNIMVFNRLQHTITGWPGGKPNTDDTNRPERALPAKKRVLIFSPHPDDDVISMGGTFLRLVEQGHDVHVVYQTSGNIAVHDHDALRYLEFFKELSEQNPNNNFPDEYRKLIKSLKGKSKNKNTIYARKIKGLIRKGEATAAARFCGLKDDHIHFLNLPFYETGLTRKSDISKKDIDLTCQILKEIKPHQIFAAGDLADPHGTHRICLNIILESLEKLKKGNPWLKNCWLWLYRGAWQEFSIDEIEMAVPLSPKELLKKRSAIFMHQSQKDKAPFPGTDNREFWQRSEERNRHTAASYRHLGFAEYEAIEAFRRYHY